MITKGIQGEVVNNMKQWQSIEDAVTGLTGQVIDKTENSFVRLIMEIIQRDSQMHHWIEEWIADSLEYKTVSLTPEELGQVWELIERHLELEKKVVEIVELTLKS